MAQKHYCTLSIKMGEYNTMEWHADNVDVSIEDLLDGFYGCLVGLTYTPETIIEDIKEWVDIKQQ